LAIRDTANNRITRIENSRRNFAPPFTAGHDRNASHPSSSASRTKAGTPITTGANTPASASTKVIPGSVSFGAACSLATYG